MTPFWTIRHIPTGGYLPETKRDGYTSTKPSTTLPPRLFKSEKSAKNALTCWLKGKHYIDYDVNSYDGDTIFFVGVKKIPDRKREDMEVISVAVIEVQPELSLDYHARVTE